MHNDYLDIAPDEGAEASIGIVVVPDGDAAKTNAQMLRFALAGNKTDCLKFFQTPSNKVKLRESVPNILAALMYSAIDEAEILVLLTEKPFKAHLQAKPSLRLEGFTEFDDKGSLIKRNLAEVAAWCNRPKVLDHLLSNGIKMPKPKISKIASKSLEGGERHDTDVGVAMTKNEYNYVMSGWHVPEDSTDGTWQRNEHHTSPIPRPPIYGYSEQVQRVLTKHVFKRYLHFRGKPGEAKQRRSARMWMKHAQTCFMNACHFHLAKHKITQVLATVSANHALDAKMARRIIDLMLCLFVDKHHPIFTFSVKDPSRPPPSPPSQHQGTTVNVTRLQRPYRAHLDMFAKKDLGSKLGKLFDNALCEPRGASLPRS